MRKLIVFNHVTLDGYFTDSKGDMSWAHRGNDEEIQTFTAENAQGGGQLLLGRVTYDLMASFWPTPNAMKSMPEVAEGMNSMKKVVFSRTMEHASWSNTTVVKDDIAGAVRRMKEEEGVGMAILGSGSIVSQLAGEGLIDEYQMMVNPIALGGGRTMFDGMKGQLNLKLARSRVFRSGKVFLSYEPVG